MKFCRNCGEHLEADSVFCAKCGARQEATAVVQPNQSQKKSRILIILAVVVVIAIAVFFIYSNSVHPLIGTWEVDGGEARIVFNRDGTGERDVLVRNTPDFDYTGAHDPSYSYRTRPFSWEVDGNHLTFEFDPEGDFFLELYFGRRTVIGRRFEIRGNTLILGSGLNIEEFHRVR